MNRLEPAVSERTPQISGRLERASQCGLEFIIESEAQLHRWPSKSAPSAEPPANEPRRASPRPDAHRSSGPARKATRPAASPAKWTRRGVGCPPTPAPHRAIARRAPTRRLGSGLRPR